MAENILVLTNNFGGLHSFRKEVMQALLDAGYKVYISAPKGDFSDYFQNIGCEVIESQFERRGTNPIADLKQCLSYIKLIRGVKPKAVLTYTIKPNVYGGMACRVCKVPQLANITGLGDAVETPGFLQKLTIILYRVGLAKAKTVFFQNAYNRQFCLDKKMVKSPTVLLPGSGVNINWHTVQPYPEDGVTRFIYVGRLLVQKGCSELFTTIGKIKEKYGDSVEFHICGVCEDDYQKQLDEYVAKKYVIFHGRVSDVRPYYKEVHCNIMPSWHEGMSNVCLESAAAGRPSITTNVPGCKETVDDGVTGFLTEARNEASLTEAVEKFIHLPYETKKQMGLAARSKVEKEFDRQIVVEAYLKAINNL